MHEDVHSLVSTSFAFPISEAFLFVEEMAMILIAVVKTRRHDNFTVT